MAEQRAKPKAFLARLIELLFPVTRCLACGGDAVLDPDGLCADCKARLDGCGGCIRAFAGQALCLCAFHYEGAAAELVRRLKFSGIKACGVVLGRYLARTALAAGAGGDCVVAVPISRKRYSGRGFNQSEVIAQKVADELSLPLLPLLTKTRDTQAQSSLSRRARAANVLDAYAAAPQTRGRHIILIDDVLTTGATISECRYTLMRAGAASVTLLCAAVAAPPSEPG